MQMRILLRKVLQHELFQQQPPVFVDVGASGGLSPQWDLLAPYSICIAFDADNRDFDVQESSAKGWKKLYSLNRLVSATSSDSVDFYLTRSPYCSSSLLPDSDALAPWAFRPLFDLEHVVTLPAVNLQTVLGQLGIERVDWYKSDSQGTDLRIFRSLTTDIQDRCLVAEFEPGIIDAYIGEDKLHHLMAYMDKKPFWVSGMIVKGSQRIDQDAKESLNWFQQRSIGSFLTTSPGWCEISYMNTLQADNLDLRDMLLGWIFATLKQQHGFALHLATEAQDRFGSDICSDLKHFSRQRLSKGYMKLGRDALKIILEFLQRKGK
jgi:hypothetical protein